MIEISEKKVLFIIAQENFRDDELTVPKQVLEDSGINVDVASITTDEAEGAQGFKIIPDVSVKAADIEEYEGVVVVGGPGALVLAEYEEVLQILKDAKEKDKIVASICIASVILAKADVIQGKKATVFETPDSVRALEEAGCEYTGEKVTVDGKLITANGPGAAEEFGKKVVEALTD